MSRLSLLLALMYWGVSTLVAGAAPSFVHDLPLPGTVTPPEWLAIKAPDTSTPSLFATWEFKVTPPEGSGDLAVTFYFTEIEGGSLRVYWQGADKAETLCDNLYEGVAMPNQRTLLIPKTTLGTGGTLTVQAAGPDAGISRIEWNWVATATVAVTDPDSAPALLRPGSQALRAEDVSGEAPVIATDRVQGMILSAVIRQEPTRIEQGVDFAANIESLPDAARIEVQLLGVPLERNVAVWVNDIPVNQLSLEVPDLSDPGYQRKQAGEASKWVYVGWRKGTLHVPVSALRTGENRFRFAWLEPETAGASAPPLALKNFILQLNYESSAAPSPSPSPELIGPQQHNP